MNKDSGMNLGDILAKAIAEQQSNMFKKALQEASDNGWDISLVGFSGARFYSAGSITFPQPVPRSIEKFRDVPTSVRETIKTVYRERGRLRTVSLIKALKKDCTLKEAIDFVDYCYLEEYQYS